VAAQPVVERTARAPALRDIAATDVRKTFGVTRALDGCTFGASRGEIHAIVGGNGSGKSTLAKVISGVLPADGGQVTVFGHSPSSPHDARAAGIATVFQEVLVADECTVVENLFLGSDHLFSKSMPRAAKVERADALMRELTGLEIDPYAVVGSLPLSLKQWIVIGRALLTDPQALILDESSAALDLDSTERLFAKLRRLRDDAGTAIIIVTHRIAELVEIADRATVLRDGRDVGVLERAEITERNLLALVTGRAPVDAAAHAAADLHHAAEPVLRTAGLRVWPRSAEIGFSLRRGEIVGIAGLDGQGQSEFVRALAGVERAARGAPLALRATSGDWVEIRALSDAAACGIAYVSGDRKREGIFPNLSIFENMLLARYRRSKRAGWLAVLDKPALNGLFDFHAQKLAVRMGDRGDRIGSLSGGNQQKVLIGRAFALNPVILVLNDPARGVDVGAKADLYGYLKEFAAGGRAVVYLSSEIEELPGLCDRVLVFRAGGVFDVFSGDAIQPAAMLQAMFGQARGASAGRHETAHGAGAARHGMAGADAVPREAARAAPLGPGEPAFAAGESHLSGEGPAPGFGRFALHSPAFADGARIPPRYAEHNKVSPPLSWEHPPSGTRSFALAITDPDIPAQFRFARAFAHWMVADIPPDARELPEDASARGTLPAGARELNSDFVTFGVPGFGRGYGGPWPPDAAHRYVFTLYALKTERLDIATDADYNGFVAAVLPVAITSATTIGIYGPASQPLPSQ